jgi:hypothetical protein
VYGRSVLVRILIVAAVILFLVLWVRAVVDVYRRVDLSTSAKAAWALIMLILPFVGLLIYTMLRPGDTQVARRSRR